LWLNHWNANQAVENRKRMAGEIVRFASFIRPTERNTKPTLSTGLKIRAFLKKTK
jgi:hypothetical protein